MVADLEAGHVRAERGHDARALVAEDDRQRDVPLPAHDVQVRPAHPGRRDLDLDLAGPGRGEVELADLHGLARTAEHRRAGHRHSR